MTTYNCLSCQVAYKRNREIRQDLKHRFYGKEIGISAHRRDFGNSSGHSVPESPSVVSALARIFHELPTTTVVYKEITEKPLALLNRVPSGKFNRASPLTPPASLGVR